MERRTRPQSLQRYNPMQPQVPLTPEEIAQVQELVQRNKIHCAELLEMFRRVSHQFDAIYQRTRENRAVFTLTLPVTADPAVID